MTILWPVLWSLTFGLPVVVAVLLFVVPALLRSAGADRLTRGLVALAPLTVAAGFLMPILPGAADEPTLTVDWLLLGTHLQLDTPARALLLVTALLYGAGLIAVDWAPARRRRELTAFLLLCYAGNIGVYLAADTVTFYLSYAVMSFAGFGLIINSRSDSARRAGRVYIVLTVLSEMAVLAGLLLITAAGGLMIADAPAAVVDSPYSPVIVALLLFGFGVKAGVVPLHVWLPLAHPAAPPAASAVLSGAMVKAGVMGWLRFLPMGEISLPGWGAALVIAGLAGALGAAVVGVLQNDPKVVLAYSTISQMGFIAAVVGVGLDVPELAVVCFSAAVVYAIHHGLAKGALFLGVPVWQHHAVGARRGVVALGLIGAGLAVAGAPLSSGSVGKYAAKTAVEGYEVIGVDLLTLLPFVATCSTLLLLRFGWLLVTGPSKARTRGDAELAAWLLLVVAGVVSAWAVTELWLPVTDVPGLDAVTLWDAAWPIGLGLALAGTVLLAARRGWLPAALRRADGTLIPPGDLVVVEEWAVTRAAASARRAGRRLARLHPAEHLKPPAEKTLGSLGRSLDAGERAVTSPVGSGLLLLALIVIAAAAGGLWW